MKHDRTISTLRLRPLPRMHTHFRPDRIIMHDTFVLSLSTIPLSATRATDHGQSYHPTPRRSFYLYSHAHRAAEGVSPRLSTRWRSAWRQRTRWRGKSNGRSRRAIKAHSCPFFGYSSGFDMFRSGNILRLDHRPFYRCRLDLPLYDGALTSAADTVVNGGSVRGQDCKKDDYRKTRHHWRSARASRAPSR